MSDKETENAAVEEVRQSIKAAPASHAVALASMGTGALKGSLIIQALAGLASILIIVNTVFMIRLNRLRIKNEKKDPL